VPAGRINETSVVAGCDLLPSLCKLASVEIPRGHALDGEDMSDVFLGKQRKRERPLFWNWRFRIAGEPIHHSPMLAMRDGDFKLLMNPDRSRVELYDIPRDPTQLANLAEKHPDVVERLAEQLLAWHASLPEGPNDPGAGRMNYGWPGKPVPAGAGSGKNKGKGRGRVDAPSQM
jgi:arylsulfatase A-like enzyme